MFGNVWWKPRSTCCSSAVSVGDDAQPDSVISPEGALLLDLPATATAADAAATTAASARAPQNAFLLMRLLLTWKTDSSISAGVTITRAAAVAPSRFV